MRAATPHEAAILRGFAARVDAEDADALNNLGVLLVQRGLVADGVAALVAARLRDPMLVVAQRNLEVALARGGAVSAQGEALRAEAFAHPERREAWLTLARWHVALGHEAEALEAADSLLALDPADATATALAIGVLLEAGRPEDAALRAEAAIDREPTVARWRCLLAEARYHVGRYTEALQAGQDALRCDPDAADAHLLLAYVLGDLGRGDEAHRAFQSAVLLRAAIGRGDANRALDEYDPRRFEALAPGRQAQRRSGAMLVAPDAVPAAHLIGVAARALGHGRAAAAAFHQVLETDESPQSAEALAELALDAGDAEAAFRRYDALCEAQTDRAAWWNGRGVALQQLGRLAEAESSYRRALSGDATDLPATNNLAVVLAQRGRLREALVTLLAAVEAAPSSAPLRLNLACALAMGPHPALALPHYRTVLTTDAEDADAWYGAGTVLARLDRSEDAVAAFARAVQVRPELRAASDALAIARARVGDAPEPTAGGRASAPVLPDFRLLVERAVGHRSLPLTAVTPEHRPPVPFAPTAAELDAHFSSLQRTGRGGAS